MKNYILISAVIFLLSSGTIAQPDSKYNKINKPTRNDHYTYIAANNIMMWISNNGDGSHDPRTDYTGLYWPGGENATKGAVFEDGLLFGAKIGNEIRAGGNNHRQGLQAGKIINGTGDDPTLGKYRVYKIKKNWEDLPLSSERDSYEKDYNEWPIEDGAPYIDVNKDGKPTPGIDKPKFLGDETLWYVANDMDSNRSAFMFNTLSVGLEFQTTVFAVNKFGPLGDAVFKKYLIINKGNNELQDMYLGYWSDPDLGDANDDYSGCDSVLNFSYVWNSDNFDEIYGTNPPAVGYLILQGPAVPGTPDDSAIINNRWIKGYKNLPMTSSIYYPARGWVDPGLPYVPAIEIYNQLQGLIWDGTPMINPLTGTVTKFAAPGNPETGTGWYEGDGWPDGPYPGDRRILSGMGPFNMSPGDTQEVIIGIFLTRGGNNKNSVTGLKENALIIKQCINKNFLTEIPPAPVVHSVPVENSVTLWWEKNAENFEIKDELLPDTIRFKLGSDEYAIPISNKNYKFEGYRIWQYSDEKGSDPVLLAIADISNGVDKIRHFSHEYFYLYGGINPPAPLIISPDSGTFNYYIINTDAYSENNLNNGSPYYFGVTAYAYSRYSDPPVIESKPYIIETIPGRPPVDAEYPYPPQSDIFFEHTEGTGDGSIHAKVIDPDLLTGHEYRVTFNSNSYSLIDKTDGDTLIENNYNYSIDSLHKDIIDGFVLIVENTGYKELGSRISKVRYVREIKGPGGTNILPQNVFSTSTVENKNSTWEWTILSVNEKQQLTNNLQDLAYRGNTGTDDYEIRFTTEGSEYYSSGYRLIGPIVGIDPKGKGKVPFEIWKIPSDTMEQPVRLVIKIYDSNKDTSWTFTPATGQWESFYTFEPIGGYPNPFPLTSIAFIGGTSGPHYQIGNIVIKGSQPQTGTVIKLTTWKPLSSLDKFSAVMTAPRINDNNLTKQNINNISAFPNPYYSAKSLIEDYPGYIRFTNLPKKITIRIYSLSGVFIKKIEKDEDGQYADWDLRNKDGQQVASGIYLAYLEIPGVATKVMKIAVVN